MENAEVTAETLSDNRGKFAFQDVRHGEFRITAEKDGYVDLFPPRSRGKVVRVPPPDGAPVLLALTRTSAITGKVFDSAGGTLRGAKVVALAWRLEGGRRRLIPTGSPSFTDDRGVYRIYGLAPGRYAVALAPPAAEPGGAVFPPVYFPGTLEPGRAQMLTLDSGETGRADLTAGTSPSQVSDIQGTIVGIPMEWARRSTAVSIASFGDPELPIATVLAGSDGRFAFRGVALGKYLITARGPITSWSYEGPVADAKGLWGTQLVETATAAAADIEILLGAAGSLQGRIEFEGSVRSKCYVGAQLFLHRFDAVPGTDVQSAPLTQGEFTLWNVPPGSYRAEVSGLTGGCYIAGIRLEGREVSDAVMGLEGNAHVIFILGVGLGVISGTLTGTDGKPAARGTVLLTPAMGGQLADFETRIAELDGSGTYRIEQIPPGRYEALAFGEITSHDYLDPFFVSQKGGLGIQVAPNSSVTVNLRIAK